MHSKFEKVDVESVAAGEIAVSTRVVGKTRKKRIEWLGKANAKNKRADFLVKEKGSFSEGLLAIVDVHVARWTDPEGLGDLQRLLEKHPEAASVGGACAPAVFFAAGDVAGGLLAAGACSKSGEGKSLENAWVASLNGLSMALPTASDPRGGRRNLSAAEELCVQALRAVLNVCLALPLSAEAREMLAEEARCMQACSEHGPDEEERESEAERYGLTEPSRKHAWLINNIEGIRDELARFQAQLEALDLAGKAPEPSANKRPARARL